MEVAYEMLETKRSIPPYLIPNEDGPVTWKFFCPICGTWYIDTFYKENYVQACEPCKAKWPPPEVRHDQDPWVKADR
jgi:hypothetical protein